MKIGTSTAVFTPDLKADNFAQMYLQEIISFSDAIVRVNIMNVY